MKLTIQKLDSLSPQDVLDLAKIWPEQSPAEWQSWLSGNRALFAAKFNERLLAAVCITLNGGEGELSALCVREVTRRRGVGQYLVEEVLRDNSDISNWRMADTAVENRSVMAAFMQAVGFSAQTGGWVKNQ